MVARYTTVIVNRGVWVNTLGFYRTRGYGVVTGAVCEKKPAVWPVLHPNYYAFCTIDGALWSWLCSWGMSSYKVQIDNPYTQYETIYVTH